MLVFLESEESEDCEGLLRPEGFGESRNTDDLSLLRILRILGPVREDA